MPLSASRGLVLGAKGRLYSAHARVAMLFGDETWPFKEEYVIRLERNVAKMVRRMCNVRLEDRISVNVLRGRLKLNSMWECLQDRRLQ